MKTKWATWLALAGTLALSACVVQPARTQVVYKPGPMPGPMMQGPIVIPRNWNPGEHPYYLHALSDLRQARAYLARPDYQTIQDDERWAIREIDAAINEMQQASIIDGKNPWQPMPPDAGVSRTDRFHKALQLLSKARQDASHEEDDPWARDLQRRIVHHIDEAKRAVNQAINDALS